MSRAPTTDEKTLEEVAVRLYEVGAIQFGEFTLTSGKSSPYYVDLRLVPSYPELFEKLADICTKIILEEIDEQFDRIAGVPTSGLPFAALVAHKTGLPLIYTRKKKKAHGTKKAIEGVLENGEKVLIIDDLSTTGGSVENATEMVRNGGGIVNHATVILDREEGAREALEANGIQLHFCLEISELIEYLKESSSLSEEKYSLVEEYLKRRT